jgi:ribulose-5-phosphate 4-epimerase/fuculose-1-phosphate aldolase
MIHSAIHRHVDYAHCVMHTHTGNVVTLDVGAHPHIADSAVQRRALHRRSTFMTVAINKAE